MRRICFKNTDDFVKEVVDNIEAVDVNYGDISIVAKYEEMVQILTSIKKLGFELEKAEFSNEGYCNLDYTYKDEYILSITNQGKEFYFEKMKNKNKYMDDCSTITYILDNCSSACIRYCQTDLKYEVGIESENDEIKLYETFNDMFDRLLNIQETLDEVEHFRKLFNW